MLNTRSRFFINISANFTTSSAVPTIPAVGWCTIHMAFLLISTLLAPIHTNVAALAAKPCTSASTGTGLAFNASYILNAVNTQPPPLFTFSTTFSHFCSSAVASIFSISIGSFSSPIYPIRCISATTPRPSARKLICGFIISFFSLSSFIYFIPFFLPSPDHGALAPPYRSRVGANYTLDHGALAPKKSRAGH